MGENAASFYVQGAKTTIVEGITSEIENEFLNEMVQDGLNAGLGYFSGQAMQLQETALNFAFNRGSKFAVAWFSTSVIKNQYQKFRKGRKATMLSKFLAGSDKKAEETRLIADFVKMDFDGTANSHNPTARQKRHEAKYLHESLEVNKEGVRSNLAKLNADALTRTFDMKMKTASFFNTDKALIKEVTGLTTVTDKEINKLNALSNSQAFQDSNGDWIGGNEAMISLTNLLSLHRV